MRIEGVVMVVLLAPVVWSAAVNGLQRIFRSPAQLPDDISEKMVLGIMLLSIPACLVLAWGAQFAPVHVSLSSFLPVSLRPDTSDIGEAATQAPATFGVLPWLGWSIPGLALLGSAVNAARLIFASLRLHLIASRARPDAAIGDGVRLSAHAIPPLAWGGATIILPVSLLEVLEPLQLDMIIRHEREHLRRGDTAWFALLAWIDAVLWFNPFIRAQTSRCRTAAELACDAAATGAQPAMRRAYAETLVKVLKASAGDVRQYAPAVISPAKSGDYRMRLLEIMHPDASRRKPAPVALYIAAALLALPLGAAQFAWSQTTASPADFSVAPTDGPVGDGFGLRKGPANGQLRMHEGVDFKVEPGTPVRAVAFGKVSFTGTREGYGLVVEIDHGSNRKTRYAHLQSAAVAVGDTVNAGQVIAASGSSGNSTAPHLHFEVWENDQPVDPMTVLQLPAK